MGSLFLMQLKLILYYFLGFKRWEGQDTRVFGGIVTVLRVKEITSSSISKGDHRVSSIIKARNTFRMVKMRNLAF